MFIGLYFLSSLCSSPPEKSIAQLINMFFAELKVYTIAKEEVEKATEQINWTQNDSENDNEMYSGDVCGLNMQLVIQKQNSKGYVPGLGLTNNVFGVTGIGIRPDYSNPAIYSERPIAKKYKYAKASIKYAHACNNLNRILSKLSKHNKAYKSWRVFFDN